MLTEISTLGLVSLIDWFALTFSAALFLFNTFTFLSLVHVVASIFFIFVVGIFQLETEIFILETIFLFHLNF